ncbi:hypothetical protein [Aurantiacibacter hainanensis]|uniref:hypothetical protein n=1 Tax=Aurantiacibacter hainanensis TaxID=3076114 RepID=UPI0030C6C2D1
MHFRHMMFAMVLLPQVACAQDDAAADNPGAALSDFAPKVSDEDIFTAAGFQYADGAWRRCGDPGTASYEPGQIARRGDFNADGLPDAIVTEGGTYCFGMSGLGYTLVSLSADGTWRILDDRVGIPEFLETSGIDGWPDIEVGGPGFCFPVVRWNGSVYEVNRREYEGKPCKS